MIKLKLSLNYNAEIKPVTQSIRLQRDFNSCATIQNIYNVVEVSLSKIEGYHMAITDSADAFIVKSSDIIAIMGQTNAR